MTKAPINTPKIEIGIPKIFPRGESVVASQLKKLFMLQTEVASKPDGYFAEK